MSRLIASLRKDLKLLVRNWHTILSFMILPFLLILVIGFLFGSSEVAPIKVGFEHVDTSVFPIGELIDPVNVDSCASDFSRLDLVACIAEGDGQLEVILDNSKTNLYGYAVSLLQRGIERQNERLAITSITQFKNELTEQLDSLEETESQLILVDRSVEQASGSIDLMQVSFEETHSALVQERISLQDTRSQLESLNVEFEQRSITIKQQLDTLSDDLRELDSRLLAARAGASDEYRAEIDEMRRQIDQSLRLFSNLERTLDTVEESQNVVLAQVVESSDRLDTLLENFSVYSERIGEQKDLVSSFSQTAQELKTQLAAVEDGTRSALEFSSEDILRSLNTRFVSFYDNDVRMLILPMVVMMILVFLSIVIASLLTHQELTSPAMLRVELSATPRSIIDLSKLIVISVLVLVNIALMYLIAVLSWNLSFISQLPSLLVVSIPAIIVFSQLGMALAYSVRKPFLLFVSATFSAIFFIIASGILRPVELLDPARSAFITSNPSSLFLSSATRAIFGEGFGNLEGILIWLVISSVLLIIARWMWVRTVFRD